MESAYTPLEGGGTLAETSGYDTLTASNAEHSKSTVLGKTTGIEVGMVDSSHMTPADTWIVLSILLR